MSQRAHAPKRVESVPGTLRPDCGLSQYRVANDDAGGTRSSRPELSLFENHRPASSGWGKRAALPDRPASTAPKRARPHSALDRVRSALAPTKATIQNPHNRFEYEIDARRTVDCHEVCWRILEYLSVHGVDFHQRVFPLENLGLPTAAFEAG